MTTVRLPWYAAGAAVALAVFVGGCSSTPQPVPSVVASSPNAVRTPAMQSEGPTDSTAGTGGRWAPGKGEVQPEVKLTAARALEAAGTWRGSRGTPAAIVSRLNGQGVADEATQRLAKTMTDTADVSVLQITYPQYGGLTEARSSVIVVARQNLRTNGSATTQEHTIDVRLTKDGRRWRVAGVVITEAGAKVPLSDAARATLSNQSVRLPAAARADILAGQVDDTILAVLNVVSGRYVLDVTVLDSGHPRNVFGTDRRSNHSRGTAVDIWRVNGRLVVDPNTPRDLLARVMEEAARAGATEIGGPFVPPGSGRGFYSDLVHADRVHLGVDRASNPT